MSRRGTRNVVRIAPIQTLPQTLVQVIVLTQTLAQVLTQALAQVQRVRDIYIKDKSIKLKYIMALLTWNDVKVLNPTYTSQYEAYITKS